jgi:hypothetical protein
MNPINQKQLQMDPQTTQNHSSANIFKDSSTKDTPCEKTNKKGVGATAATPINISAGSTKTMSPQTEKRTAENDIEQDSAKKRKVSIEEEKTPNLALEKADQVFPAKTFKEPINAVLVQRLLDSGVLRLNRDGGWRDKKVGCSEKTHVQKLLKKIRLDTLEVKYSKPKCGFGRVEPKNQLSLGSLRKDVRHTLCEGVGWCDIDIENCHPEILRQLLKKNGIECKALTYYCDHREDCLK